MEAIDPRGTVEHCIYRHPKWFTEHGPKDLSMLGRNMDNVIMIENNPESAAGREGNFLLVEDYMGPSGNDTTLLALRALLQGLADSQLPVPQYLRQSSLVSATSMKGGGTLNKLGTTTDISKVISEPDWDMRSLLVYVTHAIADVIAPAAYLGGLDEVNDRVPSSVVTPTDGGTAAVTGFQKSSKKRPKKAARHPPSRSPSPSQASTRRPPRGIGRRRPSGRNARRDGAWDSLPGSWYHTLPTFGWSQWLSTSVQSPYLGLLMKHSLRLMKKLVTTCALRGTN
jgi:hypothetical protein